MVTSRLPWSRGVVGLTCRPVKAEIAGSSPVGTANKGLLLAVLFTFKPTNIISRIKSEASVKLCVPYVSIIQPISSEFNNSFALFVSFVIISF